MLSHLSVNHFAIVKSLQLELFKGMTTITGETGAGKSIAIDALGLCLGGRADSNMVRPGEDKADITAAFLLDNNINATRWLEDNELADVESSESKECIIRRIITAEGRSRAFINGNPVPLSQLKALGQTLVNIHGQHAHHQLMKQEYQLTLLDLYSGHQPLINNAKKAYSNWRQLRNTLKTRQANSKENLAQKQLLEYQVKELDDLALTEDEFELLENEHRVLASSGQIAITCQGITDQLSDNEEVNALGLLQSVSQEIAELADMDSTLAHLPSLLTDAIIQIEEAHSEVRNYVENIDFDPARIELVEARFTQVMGTARKHHVMAEELYAHHQELKHQIEQLDCSDERLEQLETEVNEQFDVFVVAADKLSKSRQRYAKELNKLISKSMHELSMEKAQFCIEITNDKKYASPLGMDSVNFLVSANPGQPLQPLGKVASGGELSRISLAIQVITAQKVQTPSLIFDEVDVGISGPTAHVVGEMLRKLGESTQVICVTHLPQVAGCGHQQLFVAKQTKAGKTETQIKLLDEQQRIDELARLLGGTQITDSTRANAKELLLTPFKNVA